MWLHKMLASTKLANLLKLCLQFLSCSLGSLSKYRIALRKASKRKFLHPDNESIVLRERERKKKQIFLLPE